LKTKRFTASLTHANVQRTNCVPIINVCCEFFAGIFKHERIKEWESEILRIIVEYLDSGRCVEGIVRLLSVWDSYALMEICTTNLTIRKLHQDLLNRFCDLDGIVPHSTLKFLMESTTDVEELIRLCQRLFPYPERFHEALVSLFPKIPDKICQGEIITALLSWGVYYEDEDVEWEFGELIFQFIQEATPSELYPCASVIVDKIGDFKLCWPSKFQYLE
jgi:hypothetical protein